MRAIIRRTLIATIVVVSLLNHRHHLYSLASSTTTTTTTAFQSNSKHNSGGGGDCCFRVLLPLCSVGRYVPTTWHSRRVPQKSCSFDVPACDASSSSVASLSLVQRQQRRKQQCSRSRSTVLLYETARDDSSSSSSPVNGGGGGLVTTTAQQQQQQDNEDNVVKTQLFAAFTNLGAADQYDAVLTGLCAKILDQNTDHDAMSSSSSSATQTAAAASLQDCTDLLQEMNEQKIAASPRSLMAMMDVRRHRCHRRRCANVYMWLVCWLHSYNSFFFHFIPTRTLSACLLFAYKHKATAKTQDAKLMATVVSQCLRNPGGWYGPHWCNELPVGQGHERHVC